MKKQFLFAVTLVCAALLVGCKGNEKPDEGSKEASLTISPKELVLVKGDSPTSLSAVLTPADATAIIKWSSSNPSIVTVTNRGFVQAQDYGDCYIYASYGELKDSCFVHVQTFMEGVIFNGACLLDVDTLAYADPETGELPIREITSTSGTVYKCYKAKGTFGIFSDGFYVNNSGKLDGAPKGVLLEIDFPFWYGTKYLNDGSGVNFSLSTYLVTDTAHYMYEALPGSLDEVAYIAQQKNAIQAINDDDDSYVNFWKAAATAFSGPTLTGYEYMNFQDGSTGYGASYVPEAICTYAYFQTDNNFVGSDYMLNLEFSDIRFQQLAQDTVFGFDFGLNLGWNFETEQAYFNDEKVHYNPIAKSVFGEVPAEGEEEAEEAPRFKEMNIKAVFDSHEEFAKFNEQVKNNPNVTLIRKF